MPRKSDYTPREPSNELTPQQILIVKMIADGLTSKEIAFMLGRSIKTIECHRTIAMRKTGSNRLAQLVRYAVRTGIIEA